MAYNWREDLKADGRPSADLEQEAAGGDHAAVTGEPQQAAKEAAPPKRKKPKFL